ncbi:Hsp70 family protein [Arthrobacter sp. SX1312]|uniref:Hsp70 family protein n=1 Tax=Arthrobacter sp. SX1312 TaxID=2058896 RepID=UPI0015E2155C|nr:Hsp70 family protein [Arthrobacter sp. SX1312]
MSYGLSVDVGTSYTAAATLRTDGDGPGVPQILSLGSRAAAIPTVVFLGADGTRLVGDAAERRGAAQPDRVAREFKRRMGDDIPLMVGGEQVLPQQLVAAVVSWVVGVATEREGGAPDVVTLTHPVGWGEHRTSLLRQALAEAGIGDVVLLTEPEAAALSYAAREQVPAGSTLAVYDLGGGTFDATVLRKTDADTFAVLGTPQGLERLGGADFDQEIFDHVLESADVPLAGPEHDPAVLAALTRLRKECTEAKEALSSDSEATVSVMMPGAYSQVRIVRSEFEAMIGPALGDTLTTLRSALESAGVRGQDLTAILLIGGSSRIPLVAQLLSEEFDRPLAIDVDPKASVALGASFATSALDDAPGDGPAAAPGHGTGVPLEGAAAPTVNAAGFARPAPHSAPLPAHGPAAPPPTRRLGVRVAAIAAAVALLGIATASATNSPNPFSALSALSGDQRAEAAEGSAPTAEAGGVTATPDGTDGGVGPLLEPGDAGTFLDRTEAMAGTAPDGAGQATPSGTATEKSAGASSDPTKQATPTPGTPTKAASKDPKPAGDTKPTPPRTSTPSPSAPEPGAGPVGPTPPAPSPSPTPAPPVTEAPPVTPPTTPPVPDPVTPPPAPDPTQPPADPAPTDPPPADPDPQPTTPEAPAPADPPPADPPPADPATPSSLTSES